MGARRIFVSGFLGVNIHPPQTPLYIGGDRPSGMSCAPAMLDI